MKHLLLISLLYVAVLACEQAPPSALTPSISTERPTDSPQKTLTIGLLQEEIDLHGGIGLVDPVRGVIAYINKRNNQGAIVINDKKIALDKVVVKKGSYLFLGTETQIVTTQANYDDKAEGDCIHGTFKEITITYQGAKVDLGGIKVQDCTSLSN